MAGSHHAEWLSLLDISGPFLSPPVLEEVFPQGLDAHDPDHAAKLRLAHEEWLDEQEKDDPDPAVHDAWIRLVLTETLELTPEVLMEGNSIPSHVRLEVPEHDEEVVPDFVVMDPEKEPGSRKARLLISALSPGTEMEQPVNGSRWSASPLERMIALCRAEGVECRLGLVTNGERWMLVGAPVGETSAHVSWYAELWSSEPLTLRAFRSLLGIRRFFGVAESERLVPMLEESTNYQADVTDQLGYQVRRAVEVLVTALDRADQDAGGLLLRDIAPETIYEAALTVMMRLVFLLSAEERGLLRLGDPIYDQFYAVATLVGQLREAADQVGEEVLERREDAWSRLLGTFRAIFGGVHHDSLQIIPYGSSLFDPDRFPFLEGRGADTSWALTEATPLPIDNRTVLLLLESLQMLDLGSGRGARKLSFRALDIEQIGHVYETLLDHTAKRAEEPMVSLEGNQGFEPEISVSKLHELLVGEDGNDSLVEFLKGELKKGASAIQNALARGVEPEVVAQLQVACGGDKQLMGKLLPVHDLIRRDPWGQPMIIHAGAVFVTTGEGRRSTGTHYTPRVLTEEIVEHALEPLVYRGPAEGWATDDWRLKTPSEILSLRVCDPAMGSGAFLVQACRYLSERLSESWEEHSAAGNDDQVSDQVLSETSNSPTERLAFARRLVASRCLFGVDVNHLAVEMAKLSMWLVTLSRNEPFTFLDHAFKCGDSLFGIHSVRQLRSITRNTGSINDRTFWEPTAAVETALAEAAQLRRELEDIIAHDVHDVSRKRRLHERASESMERLRLLGDITVATSSVPRDAVEDGAAEWRTGMAVREWLGGDTESEIGLRDQTHERLARAQLASRPRMHWPLEFPEIFEGESPGFDAVIMNPPFMGGTVIRSRFGDSYRRFLHETLADDRRGRFDLAVFFLLRAQQLTNPNGMIGAIATDSIADGDNRTMLSELTEAHAGLVRAVSTRPWPGSSNQDVSILWLAKGTWDGGRTLDGISVDQISPSLTTVFGDPAPLKENKGGAYLGVYVLGTGFVLSGEEASALLAADPNNAEVVRPYLSGDDVNSTIDGLPTRWVIDFGERTEEEARQFKDPWRIVEERVKPDRLQKDRSRYPRMVDEWWKFWNPRIELQSKLADLDQVVVIARVGKPGYPRLSGTDMVINEKVVVFPFDDCGIFAVLSSTFHWWWAASQAGARGSRISYTPTRCFDTFPLPRIGSDLNQAGLDLWQFRAETMKAKGLSFTSTYNLFNEAGITDQVTRDLRALHRRVDEAFASSMGWSDFSFKYETWRTRWDNRYTFSLPVAQEALRRLHDENQRRAQ